jgi:hypothetical protein
MTLTPISSYETASRLCHLYPAKHYEVVFLPIHLIQHPQVLMARFGLAHSLLFDPAQRFQPAFAFGACDLFSAESCPAPAHCPALTKTVN